MILIRKGVLKKVLQIVFLLYLPFVLSRCTSQKGTAPDVSGIKIKTHFYRIDQQMKQLTLSHLDSLGIWKQKHPQFWSIMIHEILGIKKKIDPRDTGFIHQWKLLSQDTVYRILQHKIDSLYTNFTPYESQILQSLKYLKYYFPDRQIPDVYLVHSNLGVAQFLFEEKSGREGLGIGLDFYLGKAFPYHFLAPFDPLFSKYNARHFDPPHLVRGAMWALVDDIAGTPVGQRMIDLMVHNGKKLYILQKLMPQTPDSILINYTPKEMKWVENNTKEIWALFLNEKLLYESSSNKINTYVNPAPSSRNMPPESPGRTANWVGWQIIRQYMHRHPEYSLQELLKQNDAQKILLDSKYKP